MVLKIVNNTSCYDLCAVADGVISTKIVNLEYAICKKADLLPNVNHLTEDAAKRLICNSTLNDMGGNCGG